MKRICFYFVLASVMLAGIFYARIPSAMAASVEAIEVHVESDDSLPDVVRQRMEKSVASISEQMMLGLELDRVMADKKKNEDIIWQVFDKILVGYTVSGVELEPGGNTRVVVKLLPWDDTISKVSVDVEIYGLSPLITEMALQDAAGIEKVFSDALEGLPLAATDWSNGAVRQTVNSFMKENLPEFRADFTLDVDRETDVKVTIYPLVPVVRTVDLKMRSDTFPNISLLGFRSSVQSEANQLLGAPVAFVSRHRQDLEYHFASILDESPDFKTFDAHTRVFIEPLENLSLMTRSDTDRLRVRGEAWTDIGSSIPDGDREHRLRGEIGWMLSPHDKLYFIGEFFPEEDFEWQSHAGYCHELLPGLWAGLQGNMQAGKLETELAWHIAPRWSIRHEYRAGDGLNEFAIRYKLHDFISLEGVLSDGREWLRVISSF